MVFNRSTDLPNYSLDRDGTPDRLNAKCDDPRGAAAASNFRPTSEDNELRPSCRPPSQLRPYSRSERVSSCSGEFITRMATVALPTGIKPTMNVPRMAKCSSRILGEG